MKDVETKHKFSVRDGALAKVRAVTVIVPTKQDLPKGAKSMPMLVLHLEDAAAGTAWDEFLPKLVGEIAGEKPPQPSSETVGGVKVHSLPCNRLTVAITGPLRPQRDNTGDRARPEVGQYRSHS